MSSATCCSCRRILNASRNPVATQVADADYESLITQSITCLINDISCKCVFVFLYTSGPSLTKLHGLTSVVKVAPGNCLPRWCFALTHRLLWDAFVFLNKLLSAFPMKLPSDECNKSSLMISQHWYSYWLAAVRQQAFTWTYFANVVCCHMEPGANELTQCGLNKLSDIGQTVFLNVYSWEERIYLIKCYWMSNGWLITIGPGNGWAPWWPAWLSAYVTKFNRTHPCRGMWKTVAMTFRA